MSNRFYFDECAEEIFDSKIEDYPATADICSILNKQQVIIDKYKEEVKKLNFGVVHLKNQLKQAKEKLAEKDSQIRHEICEKIRNELGMTIENSKENTVHCVFYNNMSEILDQIEQGEE